jgi:hypothetical protein
MHINGKEYLSSKDACAVSGYSEQELLKMCKEKHVFFRKVKGGVFVLKESLMMHLHAKPRAGKEHLSIERAVFFAEEVIAHEKKLLFHNRKVALAMVGLLLVVLMVPIFFSKNKNISAEGNLSSVSSVMTNSDVLLGGSTPK